ncbi:hypothetical protein PIROE2DRAFT_14471 [Piromyces sp. E2]|nr:hypothetical protein PIROE2DRAFT_14471 [Piromyces sp. E2]|eukprot:OUM59886.1 hypothetical protein PIROE2DRAFT_14471 [Piromyces sp. E2]
MKSYYNNYNNAYICKKYIKKDYLLKENSYSKKSLLENNKIIVGAFICTFKYEKEQYIEELQSMIKDDNHNIINDIFFEWKIENWSNLQNDEFSNEFEVRNNKWKILLNPNGYDDKIDDDYISVYLKNIDANKNISNHIYAKCLLAIRNYNDYSCFYTDGETKYDHYHKYNDSCNWDQFIKRKEFNKISINSNKSLIEDSKTVISTYIRLYKYEKEQYLEELKNFINDNGNEIINDGYYEWNIDEWNKLQNNNLSEEFEIGNHKWNIFLCTNNDKNGYVSIYLNSRDVEKDVFAHIYVKYILTIRNKNDYSCFYINGESDFNYYNKYNNSHGWKNFIKNKDLFIFNKDSSKPLVENNKTVIGVYIRIYKYDEEQYIDELRSLVQKNTCEILNDGYCEWTINKWNELLNDEFSKEFIIDDNKW